jgi:integrase
MPTKRITQLFLDRVTLPQTGRVSYHDKSGLILRVSASEAKSWSVTYRVGGKKFRETLGTVAQIPNVAEARRRALASREQAEAGINPVVARRRATELANANTFGAAAERWLDEGKARNGDKWKPKTAQEWRRIFAHDVLPRWGARPLGEIKKADVLELLHDKAAGRERARKDGFGGAAVQAGKMLSRLNTFFEWCVRTERLVSNPAANMLKPAREAERDRWLNDAEIRAFWSAAGTLEARFCGLVRLMLLTGQRRSEVGGICKAELDFENQRWTIPGRRTKNGKEHIVHLSALALEVIGEIPVSDLATGRIPGSSSFGRAKKRLDAEMGSDIPPWVLHDLRRTATTVMAEIGVAPHVADKVLNHTSGTIRGVARVYNRSLYIKERKDALEALGRYVENLIRPTPSNVVPIRA